MLSQLGLDSLALDPQETFLPLEALGFALELAPFSGAFEVCVGEGGDLGAQFAEKLGLPLEVLAALEEAEWVRGYSWAFAPLAAACLRKLTIFWSSLARSANFTNNSLRILFSATRASSSSSPGPEE